MKTFLTTAIIGTSLLIVAILIIAVLRVEEQRVRIQHQKDIINELNIELHTMEVMYLKCAGSIKVEQHGAHYSDGKIKFYKTK